MDGMSQKTYSDLLIECLIAKKEELQLTNAVVASKSGVPESTVTKLFNRTIKSPTFDTVAPVAEALGVSLDALIGVEYADVTISSATDSRFATDSRLFTALIDSYTRQLSIKNRWITLLAAALFAVLALALTVVVYDVTHPTVGWVQYTAYARSLVQGLRDIFHL